MQAARADTLSTAVGLYVHFPWCVRKCPYCDFNSHPLNTALDEERYVAALQADLKASLPLDARIQTVFFGGGTPSLFSPRAFEILLANLEPWLENDAEITMEANPGTTEHHDLAGYRSAGVNRLSLGAQSFNDSQLRQLGRIHTAEETLYSYAKARAAGFDNVNLDLMYGLPGQTAQDALTDLQHALALEPEHVSWYQLTIEPRTEFARRPPLLATESAIDTMETRGRELLESAGYGRYEVSAYARDGRACRHNINYWSFGDYFGIGAGAHGKLTCTDGALHSLVRTRKASQPRLYLKDPTATMSEPVARTDLVFEFMLNALRLRNGVSFECFHARTGLDPLVLEPLWSELVAEDLVERKSIAATGHGYRYLDSVIQRFLT